MFELYSTNVCMSRSKNWVCSQLAAHRLATKRKNLFYYLSGLGNLPNRAMFRVELEGDTLILSHASPRAFRKDKIIQQYKIAAADILAFDIVTEAELENRSAKN